MSMSDYTIRASAGDTDVFIVARADGTEAGYIIRGFLGGMTLHSAVRGTVLASYTCESGMTLEDGAQELLRKTDPHACPAHRVTTPVFTMGQARANLRTPVTHMAWAQFPGQYPEAAVCCARGAHARYLMRAALREPTRD